MKKVTLTVNGVRHEVEVSPELVLLDYLRGDLNLTGTKQSCDRKGLCGACTVIINGKTATSCIKKVTDLEGANIISIEGLGTPENPHLIQEAFVLAGAVQCGFCIPGMVMATKALLDSNKNPSVPDIKKALAKNLCRCTGYKKIIEAVQLSAKFINGETTPAAIRAAIPKGMIGVSHPRPSGLLKACGKAIFGGDIKKPNMADLAVVHSTEIHAKILGIDAAEALKMPGVIGIMTADDVKGTNRIRLILADQPVLCEVGGRAKLLGDPIAAVAADTREHARAAAAKVKVSYQPLKVMLTPAEALAADAIPIHDQPAPFVPPNTNLNICMMAPCIKGDADKAMAKAKYVVEAEFNTQMNHQSPLEQEVSVAYLEGEGDKAKLIVYGRSIFIGADVGAISEATGFKNVEYREPYVGGQFGIKANETTECVTAAAALHFKRPIRFQPSVQESMWMSSKRHPFQMKVKLGADAAGHIIAYTNDTTVNKGAYFALGLKVVERAILMLAGAYNIPEIKFTSKLVYTNNGWGGVARAAGPPQVTFALESAVNMLAEKMGKDRLEFRKMNSLKVGQSKSTGYVVKMWTFPEICDLIKPHYDRALKDAAEFNKTAGKIRRGVGIAGIAFGIGETGDSATVSVEIMPDNSYTIYAAIADPGEGNDSMLTQIAADQLGLPMSKINLYTRSSEKTIPMGPAAASRMTYMGGGAVVIAITNLKKAMADAGAKNYADLKKAGKPFRYDGTKTIDGPAHIDPMTGQGASFESDVQNIQMAEIEVNTETGDVKVLKMTTSVDAGVILHPQNLQGQLEGGMDQGVGYALREEYIQGKTRDWVTFKMPTMNTAFESEIITKETPRPNGTLGATGIGEMTMVSTAPAVTDAIYDACGVRIFSLPATPEKIKAGLAAKKK